MTHIAHSQRGDTHLDLVGLVDFDLRPVRAAPARAVLTEPIMVGNLVQRAVFTMRIDDEDTGLVMRLHQFFDDNAGEVALASTGTGDDGKVCANEVLDAEYDGYCARGTREQ